ncbi:MAG TPA: HAD family hydrolase [Anaerolineales bacterium]|nr:HAD family hydrolase [Anaerolineales bacterium]
MFPALFLDRDGVIIENCTNYVRTWQDVSVLPGALEALASLSTSPYKIIIITNQSAIGRGILPIETAHEINRRLVQIIGEAGGRVDGVYLCPHAPQDHCPCRKPQPGLLLQAAQELSLDIPRSTLVGDAWSDLQAGRAAGVPQRILLRTGRGHDQLLLPPPPGLDDFQVCDDLHAAVKFLELHQL